MDSPQHHHPSIPAAPRKPPNNLFVSNTNNRSHRNLLLKPSSSTEAMEKNSKNKKSTGQGSSKGTKSKRSPPGFQNAALTSTRNQQGQRSRHLQNEADHMLDSHNPRLVMTKMEYYNDTGAYTDRNCYDNYLPSSKNTQQRKHPHASNSGKKSGYTEKGSKKQHSNTSSKQPHYNPAGLTKKKKTQPYPNLPKSPSSRHHNNNRESNKLSHQQQQPFASHVQLFEKQHKKESNTKDSSHFEKQYRNDKEFVASHWRGANKNTIASTREDDVQTSMMQGSEREDHEEEKKMLKLLSHNITATADEDDEQSRSSRGGQDSSESQNRNHKQSQHRILNQGPLEAQMRCVASISDGGFWLEESDFCQRQILSKRVMDYIIERRVIKDWEYDELYQDVVSHFPHHEGHFKQVLIEILQYLDS